MFVPLADCLIGLKKWQPQPNCNSTGTSPYYRSTVILSKVYFIDNINSSTLSRKGRAGIPAVDYDFLTHRQQIFEGTHWLVLMQKRWQNGRTVYRPAPQSAAFGKSPAAFPLVDGSDGNRFLKKSVLTKPHVQAIELQESNSRKIVFSTAQPGSAGLGDLARASASRLRFCSFMRLARLTLGFIRRRAGRLAAKPLTAFSTTPGGDMPQLKPKI